MAMNKQVEEKDLGDYVVYSDGKVYSKKSSIFLKPRLGNRGYLFISIPYGGKLKNFNIHRMLAQAFIPNPDGKPMVNHINGIKDDNRLENLEWVTNKENMIHAVKIGLITMNHSKKVVIDMETGVFYESGSELARLLGWIPTSLLAKLNGNRSPIKKYKFV